MSPKLGEKGCQIEWASFHGLLKLLNLFVKFKAKWPKTINRFFTIFSFSDPGCNSGAHFEHEKWDQILFRAKSIKCY